VIYDQAPCCNISSTWVKYRINGIIPPHVHTSTMEFMSIWLYLCTPILQMWHKYVCKHGFSCKCTLKWTMYICIYARLYLVIKYWIYCTHFHSMTVWMNSTILHLVPLHVMSYIKDFKIITSINTYNINICNAEFNLFHGSDRFMSFSTDECWY
jgi:hypothetical protein